MSHDVDARLASSKGTIEALLKSTKTKSDYRRALCLWLRVVFSMSANEIATALGLRPVTVRSIQSHFNRAGIKAVLGVGRGGSRRGYLTKEEEEALVFKYRRRTRYGAPLNVIALRAEFERKVGRRVPSSTIYRLLARYGCRSLLPRPRSKAAT